MSTAASAPASQSQPSPAPSKQIGRKWTPHPAQAAIFNDQTRFRLVSAGRRFGKTLFARRYAFEVALLNPDTYVWWVAPTYQDANELGFEPLVDIIPEHLIDGSPKRSAPRKIPLTNGSVISFRSGERQDSLRGRGLDFIVIDEAGSVPGRAWRSELRPTLSDTLGSMLAIGTPRGRNWFHTWFQRGQDDAYGNTRSWQFTSYDNPFIPDSEIDEASEELPERVFRQEYLAEFLEDEGSVFGRVKSRNVQAYPLAGTMGVPPYHIGVDLGRANNFTAVSILDSTGLLVHAERLRGDLWKTIQSSVERVAKQYAPCNVRLDATRDNSIIENLQRSLRNVAVMPVKFTAQKKRDMIENLAARLELGEVMLSEDAGDLVNELTGYSYETTRSGNIRYGAPPELHDDYVDALALAAKQPESTSGAW